MNEFKTANGTILYYRVSYDLGGYNYFTSQAIERGYYLIIQRQRNEFKAFTDLSDNAGAANMLLKTVSRKSKKAQSEADTMALDELAKVADIYGL